MRRNGLLIGEMAKRCGVSRKALRLYEEAGILPAPGRTEAGYRVYGPETLTLLAFITHSRHLGLSLNEIKEIVQIKRSGRAPCPHVLDLVRQKVRELDRALVEMANVRRGLQRLLRSPSSAPRGEAMICAHIEGLTLPKERR
jgi:DNA-binding transcriptional MerR regulator